MSYEREIRNASSIYDLFSIVKEIVGEYTGIERLNTEIVFSELGFYENGFIGALYHPYSNTIAINTSPLRKIVQRYPSLVKYYLFHLLLHEYIHALGISNEIKTRKLAHTISKKYFGEKHILTRLSINMKSIFYEERENFDDFFNEIDRIFSMIRLLTNNLYRDFY